MASLAFQLGTLFRSERDRLLRRVRTVVRNRTDAEDLVQDIFVNMLRHADRPVASPRNYLARAATNAALDHLRRKRVQDAVIHPGLDPALQLVAAQPGAEAILQSRQELMALQGAVAALPPKCRVVFLLSREHGLAMREIALRMGISEKTVEKHLLKAMLRCRAALYAAGREY